MDKKKIFWVCILYFLVFSFESCKCEEKKGLIQLVSDFDSLLVDITGDKNVQSAYSSYISDLFYCCNSNACLIDSINKHKSFFEDAFNTISSIGLRDSFFIIEDNVLLSIKTKSNFYKQFLERHNNFFFQNYLEDLEIQGIFTPSTISVTKRFNEYLKYDTFEERLFVITILISLSQR